jgi:hypothetical protein
MSLQGYIHTSLLQAEEQALQRRLDETKELEDKRAEIYNHLTGDMLTENPDVANSTFGPNRKIGYLYKGMTPEERDTVRKEQLQQIVENKVSFLFDIFSY